MATTLAFDVYGTLIDTSGVAVALQQHVGERANAFAGLWREKQLEYSFRRGLMQQYETFTVCTPSVFVKCAPNRLQSAGLSMYAFSNGPQADVRQLLQTAGIEYFFSDIVSVDEIKSFKPDPAVYEHFLHRAKTTSSEAWLISSNPFDVIGAMAVGMRAVWVKRSEKALFDPWGITPTVTITRLSELTTAIQA